MTFVTACSTNEIPEEGLAAIDVDFNGETLPVMVGRVAGEWVAYLNICPHQGRMLNYAPNRFLLKDQQVICAAHGAVFNLTDGLCTGGPCKGSRLKALPCRVETGNLQINAPTDRS